MPVNSIIKVSCLRIPRSHLNNKHDSRHPQFKTMQFQHAAIELVLTKRMNE